MKKIKIYWPDNIEPWDTQEEMESIVREIEEQHIKTGEWDDWYAPGEAWSLEVEKVPRKLSRYFEEIIEG